MTCPFSLFDASADTQLAYGALGDLGLGYAIWSQDEAALLVPCLRLVPRVVRRVVTGGTIFWALYGARLGLFEESALRWDSSPWSFVWGDFALFETGQPWVHDTILLRGVVEVPNLTLVMRYVRELKATRSRL